MDRAGAASIDSSWAMMAGTALRSNLACPSSWSRSSPQIRVGSAGCGRRWPGPRARLRAEWDPSRAAAAAGHGRDPCRHALRQAGRWRCWPCPSQPAGGRSWSAPTPPAPPTPSSTSSSAATFGSRSGSTATIVSNRRSWICPSRHGSPPWTPTADPAGVPGSPSWPGWSLRRAGPSPKLARAYAIMCLPAGSVAINPLARMYGRRALEVASTVEQLWPWRACASSSACTTWAPCGGRKSRRQSGRPRRLVGRGRRGTGAGAPMSVSLFEGVPADEVAVALAGLERRRFAAGSTVLVEGDYLGELYLVESGAADVFAVGRDGTEHHLARVGPRTTLGEMSLFTGQPASGTVRARTDLQVVVVTARALERLGDRLPRVYRNIGVILAERLAASTRLLVGDRPGRVTVLVDRGAPPDLAPAIAASVAWHTRAPVALTGPGGI